MILPKKVVIEINKGILNKSLEKNPTQIEKISVGRNELSNMLEKAGQQDGFIMQVAYLMAGITWSQPFGGGNKMQDNCRRNSIFFDQQDPNCRIMQE